MARNPKEKLQLLQEFLSLVPKHKGTEKLRANVKTKMATLRKEIGEKKRRKVGGKVQNILSRKKGPPKSSSWDRLKWGEAAF